MDLSRDEVTAAFQCWAVGGGQACEEAKQRTDNRGSPGREGHRSLSFFRFQANQVGEGPEPSLLAANQGASAHQNAFAGLVQLKPSVQVVENFGVTDGPPGRHTKARTL